MAFIPSPETNSYPDPFVEAAVGDDLLMGLLYDAAQTGYMLAILRSHSAARNRPMNVGTLVDEENNLLAQAEEQESVLKSVWRSFGGDLDAFDGWVEMRNLQHLAETLTDPDEIAAARNNFLLAREELREYLDSPDYHGPPTGL